ncbi:putative sulfate/molybdate transporter [Chelativorans sp. YIM 93263]|uniref:putative sulfate/molybdate transporter n=1 Tax=Chelativorans sp. YIM 93263 TaxID=2906648 RepID=UPI0023799C44|nr:putative sulfate/molybdate transporter [Chelativorans sp. YIM 93263]
MRARGERFIFSLRELSGALGDLGTLLPLMLGAIAVVGLAPTPVLLGFAVFYIATAVHYRLPIPVQPMKAVAAVLLTAGIAPAGLVASGVMIGLVLLVLGLTGWITRLARIVPQSVLAGLQLGLGLALALVSVDLMATAPDVAVLTLSLLLGLLLAPRYPAALIALVLAIVLAQLFNAPGMELGSASATFSVPSLPTPAELERAVSQFVLPQLSLTLTNAVLLTALIAGDYFGDRAAHVTPARLSVTSGLANLLLTPFGALPMCHGAGGLAAHYRFGARSGTAPFVLGLALLFFAILPGGLGLATLAAIPAAGLGALLLMASGELAFTKRLFDCKPSCWPVIAVTAGVTVWIDPFWGLLAGSFAEFIRYTAVRVLRRHVRN